MFFVTRYFALSDHNKTSGGSGMFPRRGRQFQRWMWKVIIWSTFSQKVHEIERIWNPRGAQVRGATQTTPPPPHPRSANGDGNLSVYSVVLAMSKFSMRRSNPGEGINWDDQIWSPQKKPSNLPHLPPTSETSSEHLRVFLTPLPVRHLLNIWSKLGILTFFSKQFPTKKVLSQI